VYVHEATGIKRFQGTVADGAIRHFFYYPDGRMFPHFSQTEFFLNQLNIIRAGQKGKSRFPLACPTSATGPFLLRNIFNFPRPDSSTIVTGRFPEPAVSGAYIGQRRMV